MKALVYKSAGEVKIEERPKPRISNPTDAIIKVTKTTICGTDLHIRGGDVATCTAGTVLGHEGVGIVEETGDAVRGFKKGEHVLISWECIPTARAEARLTEAGWVLGNTIDGTQAEYVRIPHADSSLYPIPAGADESALVMLSDIFPTGLECGVLNGKVQPGSTVVIVGSGPVGLAAMITAQLYSPSVLIMVDQDPNRLEVAKSLGASHTIISDGNAEATIKGLTDGKGCDTVIEAVGIPATFELCQKLVAPGGVIANVGVHGTKVDLHLETLWTQNISITTALVDTVTTPMLLKLALSGKLDPSKLITHKFAFKDMESAYDTFGAASKHKALKVLIDFD
ncbi:alcohol dehydrogenase [Lachnellula occidentalis]|uniref:Alcohol dehydrogenase n=1 Tax=Lachnellula occidentalis TaxID=215460 RepID=A0A8H8S5J4_9HELO|nr:alcohol dehydrogenase [Lachnellula occidentalis]